MINERDDNMLVVLLDEMVEHSLPRVLDIHKNLKQGDVLASSEMEFLNQLIATIQECQRRYAQDRECRLIFSTLSHLVYKVVHKAYKNEQAERNQAA